jgi:hypothetical protein
MYKVMGRLAGHHWKKDPIYVAARCGSRYPILQA